MKAFFCRRPGLGVFILVTVFTTGVVLARQANPPLTSTTLVAMAPKKRPKFEPWRGKLSLERVELRGEHLVQELAGGTSVTYTLDPDLQQWSTSFLKSYEIPYGGMVMLDINSGKVLVMAGHSSQAPKMGPEQLCLTPWAPAASVFKLVTTSALLETGVPGDTMVCYHGGLRKLQKHHLVDNPRLDKTCKSLGYAVAKSVNPIMGKLALRYLNPNLLRSWAKRFGFNQSIPFDLPVQPSRASIPSGRLELARIAAGFWHTEISILHAALIGGVAATDGLLIRPRAVESVKRRDGRTIIPHSPSPDRIIGRRSARQLASMMVDTTKIGTARRAFHSRRGQPFLSDIEVGGKTGSLSRKDPFLHYNWFVGFAPAKKPRVAFAVLLGNPAKWRIKAHTAARMLLDRYFRSVRGAPESPTRTLASR